ncbi:hypothetical protein Hamer_G019251, partial [Homarus americanus]
MAGAPDTTLLSLENAYEMLNAPLTTLVTETNSCDDNYTSNVCSEGQSCQKETTMQPVQCHLAPAVNQSTNVSWGQGNYHTDGTGFGIGKEHINHNFPSGNTKLETYLVNIVPQTAIIPTAYPAGMSHTVPQTAQAQAFNFVGDQLQPHTQLLHNAVISGGDTKALSNDASTVTVDQTSGNKIMNCKLDNGKSGSQALNYVEDDTVCNLNSVNLEDFQNFVYHMQKIGGSKAFSTIENAAEQAVHSPFETLGSHEKYTEKEVCQFGSLSCVNIPNDDLGAMCADSFIQQSSDTSQPNTAQPKDGTVNCIDDHLDSTGKCTNSVEINTQNILEERLQVADNTGTLLVLQSMDSQVRETKDIRESADIIQPTINSEPPIAINCMSGTNMAKGSLRRRKRKLPSTREKLYDHLVPYEDENQERKRLDAIRAKKNREKNKKLIDHQAATIRQLQAEKDSMAKVIEGQRQHEKTLLNYIEENCGITFLPYCSVKI